MTAVDGARSTPDWRGEHRQKHVTQFAGYDELYRGSTVSETACMAHAHREIHDLHEGRPGFVNMLSTGLREATAFPRCSLRSCGRHRPKVGLVRDALPARMDFRRSTAMAAPTDHLR